MRGSSLVQLMESGYNLFPKSGGVILRAMVSGGYIMQAVTPEEYVYLLDPAGIQPEAHINMASVGVLR